MSDYNTLVSDINDWLARSDMNSVAPTLVKLAEDRHANDIRVRAMTKRSRTVGTDTRFLSLPKDYIDMRRMWRLSGNDYEMVQVSPEGLRPNEASVNAPTRYAVHEEIELNADASSDVEFEMVFWSRFPRLSPGVLTNWLIENAYGCYLFGALAHAPTYLAAAERRAEFEQEYQIHKDAVLAADRRSRIGGAPRIVIRNEATP